MTRPLLAIEYHKAPVAGGGKCWACTCREYLVVFFFCSDWYVQKGADLAGRNDDDEI